MKKMGNSPAGLLSAANDQLGFFVQQIKSRRRLVCIILAGLAVILASLLVLFSAVRSPSGQAWLAIWSYGKMTRNYEKKVSTRTDFSAEWRTPRVLEDQNWAGLQKWRKERADGSMWWDERAEQYFISKLERSQFPANCSQAHWIAHYDWVSGLFSSVHIFTLPLFFSMVRGHTLVPISQKKHPAFRGCGPNVADLNMQCFFNVTTCNPGEESPRLSQILARRTEELRTTWDELLMENNEFFSPGGVTVIETRKMPPWDTRVLVPSSSFSSYVQAHNYHKLNVWYEMGREGKVGVVTGSADKKTKVKTCASSDQETRERRVDMVLVTLMSSWMLNRMHDSVKQVADEIMSRYLDTAGQPVWKSPVLAIHMRQTDKQWEDPYWREHGVYRPVEDYAVRMKQMEDEYGFRFASIFLISDNGTAMEALVSALNTADSATPRQEDQRTIMYDWMQDEHLVEKFGNHNRVPRALKHDMQVHFLATLFIVQKIADHAIVTYSSNVGRFIGEILAAKHKMAFVDCEGPLVTSLDTPWWWH